MYFYANDIYVVGWVEEDRFEEPIARADREYKGGRRREERAEVCDERVTESKAAAGLNSGCSGEIV